MIFIPLWKRLVALVACILGTLYAVPTFLSTDSLSHLPSWFPREQVNLGLDLQGGSHLLLEVDTKSALKDRLDSLVEDVRRALRKKQVEFQGLRLENDTVVVQLMDPSVGAQALSEFHSPSNDILIETKGVYTTLRFSEQFIAQYERNIISQSREIVERRINELGTREPNVQLQGRNGIIVQLPGVNDPTQAKLILGKTAKLTFRLVHPQYQTLEATGGRVLPGVDAIPLDESQVDRSHRSVVYLVKKQVYLTGENLVDAQVAFHPQTGEPQVSIRFDTAGARKFGEVTKNNTGGALAIILDDRVISAPNINEPIFGGNAVITGRFTVQEASNLALLMRAGSLPAPIAVVEERTVGPDLGADSVLAGKHATIVSVIFVAVFMIVAYALFGIFANVAMVLNLVFLISALALTGSTLTLPGIAGIALTLGMAVDANVLIYERIKEELRLGRKIVAAVDAGYERAMATIIDSNLTTLIGAAALYFFGTGPIRGFGVTLAIGIVISMFTAITLTRIISAYYIRWFRPTILSI